MSLCRVHKNSVSKLLTEKNGVTLRDEFTHHKAVSRKASFYFLYEGLSFVNTGIKALPNISLQIPRKQYTQTSPGKERSTSVWWIYTSQKLSQKVSMLFFSENISFVTIDFDALQNILSQIHQKQCYHIAPWKESCNSGRWINTPWNSFSERFFLVFVWEYFLWHHRLQCSPKYHNEDPNKRVLVNCSMKTAV